MFWNRAADGAFGLRDGVIFLTVEEETRKEICREAGIKEKRTGTVLIK